jgi:Raf kinase inhibitor-like YbhB/YbcL family protein
MKTLISLAAICAALLVAGCGNGGGAATTSSIQTHAPAAARTTPTTASSAPSTIALTSAPSSTTTTTSASPATTPSPSGGAGLTGSGFALSSPAFAAGGSIPSQYTCDGEDVSPPLQWSGVPAGTKELVLVIRDPGAARGTFVHWALAGIRPSTTGFPAGGVVGQVVPGRNSFGKLGYGGPCPPAGDQPHHYVFTLSALANPSGLSSGFSAEQLNGQALGTATLVGTYGRP